MLNWIHTNSCYSDVSYSIYTTGNCNAHPNKTVYTNTTIAYNNVTIHGQNCSFYLRSETCEKIDGGSSDILYFVILKGKINLLSVVTIIMFTARVYIICINVLINGYTYLIIIMLIVPDPPKLTASNYLVKNTSVHICFNESVLFLCLCKLIVIDYKNLY